MMAGEDPATLLACDWRRWSQYRPSEVADGPLSEFVTGKQIEVELPQSMYPTFPASWKATCQRPILLKNGPVCMRMIFSGYSGDRTKLSNKDNECLTKSADLWIDIPLSPTRKNLLPNYICNEVNLRNLLSETYPGTRFLHEICSESVKATGKYPTSAIVRTAQEDLEVDEDEVPFAFDAPEVVNVPKDTAQGHKILKVPLPPNKSVGQFQPRSTLKNPIKGRTPPTRQSVRGRTARQPTSPGSIHDVVDSTPPEGFDNQKIGFEPSNIREARAHATWPVWKAAMDKEVKGLLGRGTWVEVQRTQVPAHVKIMGSQFIFKDKFTGAKARLVVRGDQQNPKPTKDKTFSPTPSATEFRIICALSTEMNYPMHSCDVVQAFTQSNSLKPGEELYIHPPIGYHHTPGIIWKLRKPLY